MKKKKEEPNTQGSSGSYKGIKDNSKIQKIEDKIDFNNLKINNKNKKPDNYSSRFLVPFNKVSRIGTKFFLEDENQNLVQSNKQCIEDDYGRNRSKTVKKYLGFINKPSHINYKQEIDGYRNLYKPLPHRLLNKNQYDGKEDWCTIDNMLRHIFKDENYEMILTYLWSLFTQPTQPLPFLGLVSKKKNTGKSTFLYFLKFIFEQNAKVIDPEDISANFNSSYIDKLVILIDESIEGKNRRKDLQKFKKLITGGTQTRKAKFQDDTDIEFYGKFIMASNDVETVLSIEDENTRFWIIEVGLLEAEIFDFKEKIKNEIPAFLYFLTHEFRPLQKQSRLWLNIDDIQTDRTKILQRNSRSELAKEVVERLTDYFVENENENEVEFTANNFLKAFGKNNETIQYFSRVMRNEFGKESKPLRRSNPFYLATPRFNRAEDNLPIQGRVYIFNYQEIKRLNPISGQTPSHEKKEEKKKNDETNDEIPF